MPRILRRLPYCHPPARPARPSLLDGQARRRQAVVHIQLAPPDLDEADDVRGALAQLHPVPVVLDTGFTHGLLLRETHLPRVGWELDRFPLTGGRVRLHRRGEPPPGPAEADDPHVVSVPTRHARLWIYPNRPGTAEPNTDRPPVQVFLPNGIIIAEEAQTPADMRSPLLGLQAIEDADLYLTAARGHASVWLRRPWWWGLMGC